MPSQYRGGPVLARISVATSDRSTRAVGTRRFSIVRGTSVNVKSGEYDVTAALSRLITTMGPESRVTVSADSQGIQGAPRRQSWHFPPNQREPCAGRPPAVACCVVLKWIYTVVREDSSGRLEAFVSGGEAPLSKSNRSSSDNCDPVGTPAHYQLRALERRRSRSIGLRPDLVLYTLNGTTAFRNRTEV